MSTDIIYVIVYSSGGFGLTTFDKELAINFAKKTESTVAELKLIADFRKESSGQAPLGPG